MSLNYLFTIPNPLVDSDRFGFGVRGVITAGGEVRLAVGSPFENNHAGAIYTFNLAGTQMSHVAGNGDLGRKVRSANNVVISGAWTENAHGRVYVFPEPYNGSGGMWEFPTPATDEQAGFSCDIYGGLEVVVGAPRHLNYVGRVGISSGSTLREVLGPYADGRFGREVRTISSQLVAIGAPGRRGGHEEFGNVFLCDTTSLVLNPITRPTAERKATTDNFAGNFGESIEVVGSYLIIGAPFDGADDAGRVYVYDLASPTIALVTTIAIRGRVRFGYAMSAFDAGRIVIAGAGSIDVVEIPTGNHVAYTARPGDVVVNPLCLGDMFGTSVCKLGTQHIAVGSVQCGLNNPVSTQYKGVVSIFEVT